MTNYILRTVGSMAAGRTWSCGIKCTSTAAIATVASTWDAAWTTLWTTATNGLDNFYNADVAIVDTITYAAAANWKTGAKILTPHASAGIAAGNTGVNQSTVFLTFTGAGNFKINHGFMKLPPPVETVFTGDVFTTAFLNSLKLVFDPFFVTLNGLAGFQQVNFNKVTNTAGDPPFTNHPLTNYEIGNKPGTQRKRTRKTRPTVIVTGVV